MGQSANQARSKINQIPSHIDNQTFWAKTRYSVAQVMPHHSLIFQSAYSFALSTVHGFSRLGSISSPPGSPRALLSGQPNQKVFSHRGAVANLI
jgi:hypothetical protein